MESSELILMELCERIIDGNGVPADRSMSVVIPIINGKGDSMKYGMYTGVRLLEHAMKIV